jgi:hypothetical protein
LLRHPKLVIEKVGVTPVLTERLPVRDIMRQALGLIWRQRGPFLRLFALPTMLIVACALGWYFWGGGSPQAVLAQWLSLTIVTAWPAVWCIRLALVPPESLWSWSEIRGALAPNGRFLLWFLMLQFCALLVQAMGTVPLQFESFATLLNAWLEPAGLAGTLAWTGMVELPGVYLLARLVLMLPALALGQETSIRTAWAQSKRNGWRLALLSAVPWMVRLIFDQVATTHAGVSVYALFVFFMCLTYWHSAIALAFAYRALVESPERTQCDARAAENLAPRKPLAIVRLLLEAMTLLRGAPASWFRVLWAPSMLAMLTTMGQDIWSDAAGLWKLALSGVSLMGLAWLAVRCHRLVLLGPVSMVRHGIKPSLQSEGLFLLWLVALYVVPSEGVFGLLGFQPFFGDGYSSILSGWNWMWWTLGTTLWAYLHARLSLIFPALALGRAQPMGMAWELSQGNGWRLLALAVATAIAAGTFFLLSAILVNFIPREYEYGPLANAVVVTSAAVFSAVKLLAFAMGVTTLSLAYRDLGGDCAGQPTS